jgi:hypothetical protein
MALARVPSASVIGAVPHPARASARRAMCVFLIRFSRLNIGVIPWE